MPGGCEVTSSGMLEPVVKINDCYQVRLAKQRQDVMEKVTLLFENCLLLCFVRFGICCFVF